MELTARRRLDYARHGKGKHALKRPLDNVRHILHALYVPWWIGVAAFGMWLLLDAERFVPLMDHAWAASQPLATEAIMTLESGIIVCWQIAGISLFFAGALAALRVPADVVYLILMSALIGTGAYGWYAVTEFTRNLPVVQMYGSERVDFVMNVGLIGAVLLAGVVWLVILHDSSQKLAAKKGSDA